VIRLFLSRQFLGFLIAGGLAAFLHWLSRIVLSHWMPFPWAVAIAYIVGMIVAFVLNSFFVFPNSPKPKTRQARDFVIVNMTFFPVVWMASVLINNALLTAGIANHTEEFSHAIAVVIPTFITFLIYKFFAFKDPHDERR
jgi:putative flippase GtrA